MRIFNLLDHLKLSSPDLSKRANGNRGPVVVWQGYSVHGDEASPLIAALLYAYYLAAAQCQEVDDYLRNSVILLAPCLNPDGSNRYAMRMNQFRGAHPVSDAGTLEHNEPWPSSRSNHYLFDLNHPLAYGYSDPSISVFRKGNLIINSIPGSTAIPMVYSQEPLISGYASEGAARQLAGQAGMTISRVGDGKVISFADNPLYRGFWIGLHKLFMNAVFFGGME